MILTFTANPSLDRTAALASELRTGERNRLGRVITQAAGRGVNLSAAVHAAGLPTLAILPADPDDPLTEALRARGVPARTVPVGHSARTNLTIAHPDGSVTTLLEPGETLTPENVSALVSALMANLPGSAYLALVGSLPPGAATDWYVRLTLMAHEVDVPVAVATSGLALDAVVAALPAVAPDVFSANAAELRRATGVDVTSALADGDISPTVAAARQLVERGIPRVLATIGVHGAVLVGPDGAWHARPEPVEVVSAVGAGDSALAGFLMARIAGLPDPDCLARAVAYGTASALRPRAESPCPDEVDDVRLTVSPVEG